jgi:hypothetical protein
MRIGACNSIDITFRSKLYHFQETRVKVGLPLEIKCEAVQTLPELQDCIFKKALLKHPDRSCEFTQPTGTLRTTQIAAGGGLNTYGKRQTKLLRFFYQA